MDRADYWSGSDYHSRRSQLGSRWSPDSSSEGIRTGSGDSALAPPLTDPGSNSEPGFLQSVVQWTRENLGIAALSFKFRSAYDYLALVGLYLDRSLFSTSQCFANGFRL